MALITPRRRVASLILAAGLALGATAVPRDSSHVIRLVYEVDALEYPRCGGQMRVMALSQYPKVVDRILKHRRGKGRDAQAGPWATGPPGDGASAEAA